MQSTPPPVVKVVVVGEDKTAKTPVVEVLEEVIQTEVHAAEAEIIMVRNQNGQHQDTKIFHQITKTTALTIILTVAKLFSVRIH